jgi:hypothetical protein
MLTSEGFGNCTLSLRRVKGKAYRPGKQHLDDLSCQLDKSSTRVRQYYFVIAQVGEHGVGRFRRPLLARFTCASMTSYIDDELHR